MNYEDRVTKEYIEDAIAGAGVKIAAGMYAGDGNDSQTISLGFTPKAVYVSYEGTLAAYRSNSDTLYYGGFAVTDHPVVAKNVTGNVTVLEIVSGGFCVHKAEKVYLNAKNYVFYYVALG